MSQKIFTYMMNIFIDKPIEYVKLLKRQMVEPVMWEKSIRFIHQKGVNHVIELGYKTVLTNLMASITKDISSIPFEKAEDLSKVKDMITKYLPQHKRVQHQVWYLLDDELFTMHLERNIS